MDRAGITAGTGSLVLSFSGVMLLAVAFVLEFIVWCQEKNHAHVGVAAKPEPTHATGGKLIKNISSGYGGKR